MKNMTERVYEMGFDNFIVRTDPSIYPDIERMLLSDLQAKHIITLDERTKPICDEAIKAGHPDIMWGNKRGGTIETENVIIQSMVNTNMRRPIRITITNNHVWSDNNHTTISYIKRGMVRVCDVPHYIVDCRTEPYVLAGTKENIVWDYDAIQTAIRHAYRMQLLEDGGGRKTPWTIGDLLLQLL